MTWKPISEAKKSQGKILQGYNKNNALGVWPIVWLGSDEESKTMTVITKNGICEVPNKINWDWMGINDEKNLLQPPEYWQPLAEPME